jgi:hypothetical protein
MHLHGPSRRALILRVAAGGLLVVGLLTGPVGAATAGPRARPRNGSGFWWSTRQDGYAEFNVQPWTDSGTDHGGYLQEGEDLAFKVYADGELVLSSTYASGSVYPVPARTVRYTLDLWAHRDPARYPLSPATHTVWKVVSRQVAHPDDLDTMPLLQLDYGVTTDLAGSTHGGRQTLTLSASHLPGAVGAGRVTGATLAVSYDDGATWRTVELTRRAGGGWTAQFDAPRGGFVSLRATARDDAGNAIAQDVIRAYRLDGHDRGSRD